MLGEGRWIYFSFFFHYLRQKSLVFCSVLPDRHFSDCAVTAGLLLSPKWWQLQTVQSFHRILCLWGPNTHSRDFPVIGQITAISNRRDIYLGEMCTFGEIQGSERLAHSGNVKAISSNKSARKEGLFWITLSITLKSSLLLACAIVIMPTPKK